MFRYSSRFGGRTYTGGAEKDGLSMLKRSEELLPEVMLGRVLVADSSWRVVAFFQIFYSILFFVMRRCHFEKQHLCNICPHPPLLGTKSRSLKDS